MSTKHDSFKVGQTDGRIRGFNQCVQAALLRK